MAPRPFNPGRRGASPMHQKPVGLSCDACVLRDIGRGFVPAAGPPNALAYIGEAPGPDEVVQGMPFCGAAGSMLARVLKIIGLQREGIRVDNITRCLAPDMNLARFPQAIDQCRYHEATLADGVEVVVALGGTATKKLLGFPAKMDGFSIEDFHGTVTRDPTDRFWVVPTFHPSYLQRGATNLMGVSAFDIARAQEVLKSGWAPDPGQLWLNPSVEWFRAWADQYILAATQDPYAYPLSVDIETPEKGADEGGLVATVNDATYQILQVNFSCGPDEGITVPYEGPYIAIIDAVVRVAAVKYLWYKGYDYPRLVAAGHAMANLWCWDMMWAAKALQSDVPMGLGFWAPLYSRWGAWKHLSKGPAAEPLTYAAIDGLQTRRVGDGIVGDLVTQGRWDVFHRQMHRFHAIVLQPATDVGVPIDRARLLAFKAKLDAEGTKLLGVIADQVPPALCPLVPKAGLSTPPGPEDVYTKARATTKKGVVKKDAPDPLKMQLYARARVVESLVLREVWCCRTCGKVQVLKSHRCQPGLKLVCTQCNGVGSGRYATGETIACFRCAGTGTQPLPDAPPDLQKAVASVPRWFWQEPFNPDSPDQLLAYALAKGHKPGKSKQTGEPSMDKEALSRLVRESGDPLYQGVLDYRGVAKVRGTYVVATEKRLDPEDRLHGTFSFKPSTMRLNGVNPNLTNVVADKGGKESLAAGFRKCVVAKGRMVEAGSGWEDLEVSNGPAR